ncbi:MAG: UDP-N-acetylglucosamine 1-carboxyvinyltransferase [Bdellovibrionales bacterium RIFOXYC1_FULL_54_43]|nr:MAG: UDP-N-acetylglucosamine 1-carboxyvinyltransferase [Bdellovibrionales bacterium RIFOXYC1_FULL_54_43]OFZ83220.1 MAG: UDP-N-acetylglucosamine 1-carboxyvinyltransferase [Bdellovibrionales bacterium RIFOXYD1_FULL_55_31]
MDKMRIRGGIALRGTVEVSGSKNAALPILISTLLTAEACRFERVPDLEDIQTTLKLLGQMGATITPALDQSQVTIRCDAISSREAPYDLVRKMRASVVVLGPLLARFGKAKVSLPGGCAIGARPINFHLAGLERLGAKIELEQGYVVAEAKRLIGANIVFEFPSVGATENVLMAAVLARGESVLENCAREPEIIDLARALKAMGAEIEGEGTEVIRVQGKDVLHGCDYRIMGDRIEAGTYLAAGLATGGTVKVKGLSPTYMDAILAKFEDAGSRVIREADAVQVIAGARPQPTDIKTLPYPGFPTDMQAQFMTAMAVAEGASVITETIFENRFMHVPELIRLGADITVRGNSALIRGRPKLLGAPLMATDLRASASLVLGGLCAEGETIVNRIYHLDRGYECMEKKLASLGAEIERIS